MEAVSARCRKCRQVLFGIDNVVNCRGKPITVQLLTGTEHDDNFGQSVGLKCNGLGNVNEADQFSESINRPEDSNTILIDEDTDSALWYLDPDSCPNWIAGIIEKTGFTRGRICCPKCGGRVGTFDFVTSGKRASSYGVRTPPIHVTKSRVDLNLIPVRAPVISSLGRGIQSRNPDYQTTPDCQMALDFVRGTDASVANSIQGANGVTSACDITGHCDVTQECNAAGGCNARTGHCCGPDDAWLTRDQTAAGHCGVRARDGVAEHCDVTRRRQCDTQEESSNVLLPFNPSIDNAAEAPAGRVIAKNQEDSCGLAYRGESTSIVGHSLSRQRADQSSAPHNGADVWGSKACQPQRLHCAVGDSASSKNPTRGVDDAHEQRDYRGISGVEGRAVAMSSPLGAAFVTQVLLSPRGEGADTRRGGAPPLSTDPAPDTGIVLCPSEVASHRTDTSPGATSVPEDASPWETTVPDDASPGATSVPEATSPWETSVPDDTSPLETNVPDDTSPWETSVPDDTSPWETSIPDDTSLAETSVPDNTLLWTTSVPEDASLGETGVPEDTSQEETGVFQEAYDGEEQSTAAPSYEDYEEADGETPSSGDPTRDALTCAVCLDFYYQPHFCEPCKHVFCSPCLRRLHASAGNATKCPLCRMLIVKCRPKSVLQQQVRTCFPIEYKARRSMEKKHGHRLAPLPGVAMSAFQYFQLRQRNQYDGTPYPSNVLAMWGGVCFVVLLMMLAFTVFATTVGFVLWYIMEVALDVVAELAVELNQFCNFSWQALIILCIEGKVPEELSHLLGETFSRILGAFTRLVDRTKTFLDEGEAPPPTMTYYVTYDVTNGTSQFLTKVAQANVANYILLAGCFTYFLYRVAKYLQRNQAA